ncbi:MAG TPA: PaaX family transcriptional regulator C-terminal domain-containing protein [Jatrophihabitantaceae bacterium]
MTRSELDEPRLSRRHAAGAGSARGLLFTVLGEFVLPSGRAVWTSTLIDVLGRLGVEEKATRQALMRTAEDGWLRAERHGRRTRWQLTTDAEQLLTDGTRRIYSFRAVMPDWDGRIVLVLARVPETDRATRHRLSTRLGWAGFGSPVPGTWLSTHTERVAEVEQLLEQAGVGDARIFVAEHVGGADLTSMVRQAWDLDLVEARYRDFLAEFAGSGPAEPLVRLVELVHAWRRFPFVDPALPRELLPRRWSGERAATLFGKQHAKWAANAVAEWAQLEPDAV